MIICFNCQQQTKRELDVLIESGDYSDYDEVIAFAVKNLVALHNEIGSKGAIVIGDEAKPAAQAVKSPSPATPKKVMKEEQATQRASTVKHDFAETQATAEIPALFLINGIGQAPYPFPQMPADQWTKGQVVTLDNWIFGQFNKFLPAKASCRALAHLLMERPEGIPMEEAGRVIADAASILGEYLSNHDRVNGIGRDDALATAFPQGGKNAEKSKSRYANQFVASQSKDGRVSGLLHDLKLIHVLEGKEARIQLTDPGWRFAVMNNPILDGAQGNPTQKFNQAEIEFIKDHIKSNVPRENFAFKAIREAIQSGADNPEKIDAFLMKYALGDHNRNLTDSFLKTQRSGAISRMSDLCLLERLRDGIRVRYNIVQPFLQDDLT